MASNRWTVYAYACLISLTWVFFVSLSSTVDYTFYLLIRCHIHTSIKSACYLRNFNSRVNKVVTIANVCRMSRKTIKRSEIKMMCVHIKVYLRLLGQSCIGLFLCTNLPDKIKFLERRKQSKTETHTRAHTHMLRHTTPNHALYVMTKNH